MDYSRTVYDLIAMLPFDIFVGCDELGIDILDKKQELICDGIIWLIHAKKQWCGNGENTKSFGMIEAMLKYGIVTSDEIENVLVKYKNRNLYTLDASLT